MQFPLSERSWSVEMLPDFLWIALMFGRRSDWSAVYRPLDVLDRFVPTGERIADGRLSGFALVPDAERQRARDALRRETPHALPSAFGHLLALFPECPAGWLYDDQECRQAPDRSLALPLLRSLVADNISKSSVRTTRFRMAAFSRSVTHRRISHSGDGVWALFPDYPSGLSTSEQKQVEAAVRALWVGQFGREAAIYPELLAWPEHFWARCRVLVPCAISVEREELPVNDSSDGPVDPESLMNVSEMRAVLVALDDLGDRLRERQRAAFDTPSSDEGNAVLLGFASRIYRLLYDLIERPSAWASGIASLHMRPLVDARILSAWLIKRNDPELFAAYREHGLGRLKLLGEHLKAEFSDTSDPRTREMLEFIDHRVNLERSDWVQPVELGAFTRTSPREMAIETGLKRDYDLNYAPFSSENHGEWPTLRDHDTVVCDEPLHRAHRVGAFRPSPRTLSSLPPQRAFAIAKDGIVAIFAHSEEDVSGEFDALQDALLAGIRANRQTSVPET